MKKILITFFLFISTYICFSQTVLLHQEVKDTTLGKRGPNLKNFGHFYFGIGFIMGEPENKGAEINYGFSKNILVGYRYKLKLNQVLAIGFDMDYNASSFFIKQHPLKTIPDTLLHDIEKINFGNVGLNGYIRFNYGKRGNRIGNFIDLGAYGDYVFSARHFTKDEKQNGNIVKTTTSHLAYYNKTNYGLLMRIGFNRYVLFGNYRWSNHFKDSYIYPELPRYTVGFQIGFHK